MPCADRGTFTARISREGGQARLSQQPLAAGLERSELDRLTALE